jgi:hypothetical protein
MRQSRWLSSPSALHLVRGVLAGCYQPLLPTGFSRRYAANLSSDAWSHAPAVPQNVCACFLFRVIGLPQLESGSASRCYPQHDFSRTRSRGCRHSFMFRPPSLLASQVVPTAVRTATGQLRLLRPGRTCFVTSARTGYASRLNQAIDGARTFTTLDSQCCRLLPPRTPSGGYSIAIELSRTSYNCLRLIALGCPNKITLLCQPIGQPSRNQFGTIAGLWLL